MSNVIIVTKDNINDFLKSPINVLQFSAKWCQPCQMLLPIMDELSEINKDIAIGKVNVDDDTDLAIEYSVKGIPAILFIKDGDVVDKTLGFKTIQELQDKVNYLKSL